MLDDLEREWNMSLSWADCAALAESSNREISALEDHGMSVGSGLSNTKTVSDLLFCTIDIL